MTRWICAMAVGMLVGCSATTETGYEPRRLGDSTAIQRGYYAAPYSPEAEAADAARKAETDKQRPDYTRP